MKARIIIPAVLAVALLPWETAAAPSTRISTICGRTRSTRGSEILAQTETVLNGQRPVNPRHRRYAPFSDSRRAVSLSYHVGPTCKGEKIPFLFPPPKKFLKIFKKLFSKSFLNGVWGNAPQEKVAPTGKETLSSHP